MAAFDFNDLNQPGDVYLKGLQEMNYNDYYGNGGQQQQGGQMGNALNMLSGLASTFTGMQMMGNAIDMAKSAASFNAGVYRQSGAASRAGAKFEASVYRQAGDAATTAANYNIAIDQLQTARNSDALGRKLNEILDTNYATQGASGISMTSRSFMAVQGAAISSAERQTIQMRNDAIQRQSMIKYQGELVKTQYENQARATEYSGEVAAMQAENQARAAEYQGKVDAYNIRSQRNQMIMGGIQDAFKSFGSMF